MSIRKQKSIAMALSYILLHDIQFRAHVSCIDLQMLQLFFKKCTGGSPMPKDHDVSRHICYCR